MGIIIDKTYQFLDTLDNSDLIDNLAKYKHKLLDNKELLKEINRLKKEKEPNKLIAGRKRIYENNDYKMYMKYYNELSFLILRINNKYKEYTNTHNCN